VYVKDEDELSQSTVWEEPRTGQDYLALLQNMMKRANSSDEDDF